MGHLSKSIENPHPHSLLTSNSVSNMSGGRRKRGSDDSHNKSDIEKTAADESDKQEQPLLDLSSVLPAGKVKANLQSNKDVGTIRKPVEKLLGKCCESIDRCVQCERTH
jgi:hypothetical protein